MTDEWKVGNHRAWFDDERNVLIMEFNGNVTIEDYWTHKQVQKEAYSKEGRNRHMIYIVNGKMDVPREVRKEMTEDLRNQSASEWPTEKVAIVKATAGSRMMFKIWAKTLGINEFKFFDSIDDTARWFNN